MFVEEVPARAGGNKRGDLQVTIPSWFPKNINVTFFHVSPSDVMKILCDEPGRTIGEIQDTLKLSRGKTTMAPARREVHTIVDLLTVLGYVNKGKRNRYYPTIKAIGVI